MVLQKADGTGHVEGFGANAVRSGGVVVRLKCQTRIPMLSHSMAKTAPPPLSTLAPKDVGLGSVTPQPEFEFTRASHVVLKTLPKNALVFELVGGAVASSVQPGAVWRVI